MDSKVCWLPVIRFLFSSGTPLTELLINSLMPFGLHHRFPKRGTFTVGQAVYCTTPEDSICIAVYGSWSPETWWP